LLKYSLISKSSPPLPIGSLKIGGDPRAGGDIHLMLEDKGVPVQIADHSKDLILMGRIDKEVRRLVCSLSHDLKFQS